jgi:hypothetical protein
MEYTNSLLWLTLWPLVIYLGYKFTRFNITHFTRLEKLEEEK